MAALSDLVGNTALVYLDDLIICSKGAEEHFSQTPQSSIELLSRLLKSSKFIWDEEQEAAYQQIKTALLNPLILKYPDNSKPFLSSRTLVKSN